MLAIYFCSSIGDSVEAQAAQAQAEAESVSNDFCLFFKTSLTNAVKLAALEDHFIPHKLYKFPTRIEYGKKRSFSSSWLNTYKWLVYSPTEDGAYCKYCALFGDNLNIKSGLKADKLVTTPLTFWTTGSLKLKDHDAKSEMHKNATVMAEEFLKVMKSKQKSIDQQLDLAVASQIEKNKQKLYPVIKTILFCGQQNIALRGHRESCSSQNPGNFRALLRFRVDSGDEVLKEHLETAPKNAMYTSNTIQNELITIIGSWFQQKILAKVMAGSKVYSILADEGRDCSNKEQMPIIIRYVDEHSSIQESFLCFVECEHGTSGAQLAVLIENTCSSVGLDMNMCRGQGYDGAGNMAGSCKGVAKLLRTKFPKAIYCHCASHKLNLCIAHACQLTSVSNMMTSISSIANFFNYSPKRQKSLEDHVATNYPMAQKSKLLPLCRTRWVERVNALEVMKDLINAVVDTFSDMASNVDKNWNRDTVSLAASLLKNIDFDFLINLVMTQMVITFTSSLTIRLQKRNIDWPSMCDQVQLVIRKLQHMRSDVQTFHQNCFEEAVDLAKKINIDVKRPRVCGRQVYRQNVLSPSTSDLSVEEQVSQHYRINLTIPLLDDVIGCLLDRFSDGQEPVLKGTMLLPSSVITVATWKSVIQPFVELYSDEIPLPHAIVAELQLWELMWTEKWASKWKLIKEEHMKAAGRVLCLTEAEINKLKTGAVPNSIASVLVETNPDIFPNVYYLLNVLAVLPVTTCEAELVFHA